MDGGPKMLLILLERDFSALYAEIHRFAECSDPQQSQYEYFELVREVGKALNNRHIQLPQIDIFLSLATFPIIHWKNQREKKITRSDFSTELQVDFPPEEFEKNTGLKVDTITIISDAAFGVVIGLLNYHAAGKEWSSVAEFLNLLSTKLKVNMLGAIMYLTCRTEAIQLKSAQFLEKVVMAMDALSEPHDRNFDRSKSTLAKLIGQEYLPGLCVCCCEVLATKPATKTNYPAKVAVIELLLSIANTEPIIFAIMMGINKGVLEFCKCANLSKEQSKTSGGDKVPSKQITATGGGGITGGIVLSSAQPKRDDKESAKESKTQPPTDFYNAAAKDSLIVWTVEHLMKTMDRYEPGEEFYESSPRFLLRLYEVRNGMASALLFLHASRLGLLL